MKKKITGLLVLACMSIVTIQAKDIKGNGEIVTRSFQVADYTELILGENIEFKKTAFFSKKNRTPVFTYTQTTGTATLEITMDENLFTWLELIEENGKLRIKAPYNEKIIPSQLEIKGSSGTLTKVRVTGCMDFHNTGNLQVDNIRLEIDGVSDIYLKNLTALAIDCDLSGVGNIRLEGKAEKGKYNLSGVGKMLAFGFDVHELECDLSGVGSMEVNASGKLNANTSGVGSIKYQGMASVVSNSSGVGKVKNAN